MLFDGALGFQVGDVVVAEFLVGCGVLGGEDWVLSRQAVSQAVGRGAQLAFRGARPGGILRVDAIRFDSCRRGRHIFELLEDYGRASGARDGRSRVRGCKERGKKSCRYVMGFVRRVVLSCKQIADGGASVPVEFHGKLGQIDGLGVRRSSGHNVSECCLLRQSPF